MVTAEEMALHQPKSVKEALSYTPGVAVGTRGASNTYDYLIIRGFAAEGQSQNNYLDGMKMQGNFYNDAVIDPYMIERAEVKTGLEQTIRANSELDLFQRFRCRALTDHV